MLHVPTDQENRRYFEEQRADNHNWAARLGYPLDAIFRPATTVLDFGCGHGALAVAAAECGAEVVAIDPNRQRIAFAIAYVAERFPTLHDRIAFVCDVVEALDGEARFDTIVSKDTFEHVSGLDGVLAAFRRLLKPDGQVYLGFSPLWYSPFGDHGFLTRKRIPWAHLVLGDAKFVAAHNAHTGLADRSVEEAGFNRLTPRDFMAGFARAGFEVVRARINAASPLKRLVFSPLDLARRLPPLERYATIGMYLTLRHGAAGRP